MTDNRNVIIAIVLSMAVLFGWQFFVAGPQMQRAQQQAEIAASSRPQAEAALATPTTNAGRHPGPGGRRRRSEIRGPRQRHRRHPARADRYRGPRGLDQPDRRAASTISNSSNIARRSIPTRPIITLLTPAGAPDAYFAEQGWAPAAGTTVALPDSKSVWTVEGDNTTLTATTPVTLRYDNGAGLIFRRTFAVDEHYLFTVTQSVENQTADAGVAVPLCARCPPRHAQGAEFLHPA